MIGLILGIIGLIAVGSLVAYAVVMTFKWLKKKIKEKLAAKNAKKVAVGDLEEIIDSCTNVISMDELEGLHDQGYTHIVATVDKNNQVSDVEIIENTDDTLDREVAELINRTDQGMVVVTG